MSTRRSFLGSVGAALCAAVLGTPRLSHSATAFPRLSARNLLRQDVQLPGDFAAASRNLVMVAFSRKQQEEVDSWSGPLGALKSEVKQLESWQATLMGDIASALRSLIEAAMRGIIKDDEVRKRYLLLYGEKPPMLANLGNPREDQILILLLDGSGDELWRSTGPWDEETEASLREAIAA